MAAKFFKLCAVYFNAKMRRNRAGHKAFFDLILGRIHACHKKLVLNHSKKIGIKFVYPHTL